MYISGHYEKGKPHGFFRKVNSVGDIDILACFIQGRLHGHCWRG